VVEIDYYKENEDDFSKRRIEPYQLANGREGWYVVSYDLERDDTRTFRLDRIRSASVLDEEFEPREGVEADTHGWLKTGEVEASQVARIWWSPDRARWAREDKRVVEELKDGAVIVELPFKGSDWLGHQILSLGGDAVVLEPEEARTAVLEGAEALAGLARS
jgi:proteasome accessory factor C